jgi:hypothetical protein
MRIEYEYELSTYSYSYTIYSEIMSTKAQHAQIH